MIRGINFAKFGCNVRSVAFCRLGDALSAHHFAIARVDKKSVVHPTSKDR